MPYFTTDFHQFFTDLRKNNNREWYHDNKKRYEKHVKKPMQVFITELIDRMQIHDSSIAITHKEAIFRIYRDIRFSKDKTPYKTNTSAAISKGGRKDTVSPGIYIELNDEKAAIYSGIYMPSPKQIKQIREGIASDMETFQSLLDAKDFQEKFNGTIHGDKYKRLPKEFTEAAEQQPYLFNKQFYYFSELEPSIILKENLPDIFIDYYLAARPLGRFFERALMEVDE